MRFVRENVERVTDDKAKAEELKALGYVEVKEEAEKPVARPEQGAGNDRCGNHQTLTGAYGVR